MAQADSSENTGIAGNTSVTSTTSITSTTGITGITGSTGSTGTTRGTDTTETTSIGPAFAERLWDHLQQRCRLNHAIRSRLAAELGSRIAPPRSGELNEPLTADRLDKENRILLGAFFQAMTAVPRHLLPERLRDTEAEALTPANVRAEQLQEVLAQLESRLGVSQLAQIYAGTINFYDNKWQRGQAFPIHWDGLRFRLLSAADNDRTPRGHLNYFCSYAARAVELLSEKGYPVAELRVAAGEVIQGIREHLQEERKAALTGRVREAMHQLSDALRQIQNLIGEIFRNVDAAKGSPLYSETFTNSVTGIKERQNRLIGSLSEVEEAGITLPDGLRDKLKGVIAAAKPMLQVDPARLDDPARFNLFAKQVQSIRKQAQAVTFEFRRIRRQSMALLRRTRNTFGRQLSEVGLALSIHDQDVRVLVNAAKELIWAQQDVGYAMELKDTDLPSNLFQVKAAWLEQRGNTAFTELEGVIAQVPFSLLRFRAAAKNALDSTFQLIRHAAPGETAAREEHPLWAAIADLGEAHTQLEQLLFGEDLKRLQELPTAITDLQRAIGMVQQQRVLQINLTGALDREERCQAGELRLAIAQRLENLNDPLRELVKISLTMPKGDGALRTARTRALHALGATQERDTVRGQNHLAELVVVPAVEWLMPQAPRYGRSRSELEKRVLYGPVKGVLPQALLFGIRQPHSTDDLGNPESARQREERVRQLVNRSGLIGTVSGLHPWWQSILKSDETEALAEEMSPIFQGDAGVGFLARITSENDEYLELNRLSDEERIQEARLMLEMLTSPDGMKRLQEALFQGAGLLATPELADLLRAHRFEFLTNQREFLQQQATEDPTEMLQPVQEILERDNWQAPFLELLAPLTMREKELWLLQLLHRHFLSHEMLLALIQTVIPSPKEFQRLMPDLAADQVARYSWFSHQSEKRAAERTSVLWVLEHLSMDGAIRSVDTGLPIIAAAGNRVNYFNSLVANRPTNPVDLALYYVRGTAILVHRLAKQLRRDVEQLSRLGLKREADLLARMMMGNS